MGTIDFSSAIHIKLHQHQRKQSQTQMQTLCLNGPFGNSQYVQYKISGLAIETLGTEMKSSYREVTESGNWGKVDEWKPVGPNTTAMQSSF